MAYPNAFHLDKFQIKFSNFPQSDLPVNEDVDMRYFDHYVKSVNLPNMSVDYLTSHIGGENHYHPVSRVNDYQPMITMEIAVSEDLRNYEYAWKYFNDLINGKYLIGSDEFIKSHIKSIDVRMLNNQGMFTSGFKFKECFLSDVTPLNLVMGTSQPATFSIAFKVTSIEFFRNPEIKSPF